MRSRILNLLLLVLLSSFAKDNVFFGKVVRVIDGDTIVVLNDANVQVKVRLEGIDCPESNQDFGTQAKKATSDLCFGRQVMVIQKGTDRYGRVLAFVFLGDYSLNHELLKLGLAWHYKRYNQDEELAQLEATARKLKVGLWSMKEPVAPWEFRSN